MFGRAFGKPRQRLKGGRLYIRVIGLAHLRRENGAFRGDSSNCGSFRHPSLAAPQSERPREALKPLANLARQTPEQPAAQQPAEKRAVDYSLAMLEVEENLQATFKKLRVDAEGSTALSVNEATSLRPLVRPTDETKVKNVGASKENWHCCLRKPLKGITRTQRRRRSKSPVLHPPKFIHCNIQPSSCSRLVSVNSTDPTATSPGLEMPAPTEFSKTEQTSHHLNDVDPKQTGAERSGAPTVEMLKNKPDSGTVSLPPTVLKATGLADFQSVSEQNKGKLCACTDKTCQCQRWQDMKVYMFSDLQRSLPSAPERTHVQDNPQGLLSRTPSSSLRSCSEQARANVDDVTIEDLSGYMENFLYIPKKMSHMAEMMYT